MPKMPFTIYNAFVVQTQHALHALSAIAAKAEQHPNASTFPTSRLHADMKSFSYQIFAATAQTQMGLARLTNSPPPDIDRSQDVTLTYPEMHRRIDGALDALANVDETVVIEHAETVAPAGPMNVPLSGAAFACMLQANIFFHVTTAYGILRMNGVDIGKADYILHFFKEIEMDKASK